MSRTYIPVELRRQVLAADQHRCAYCLSSELLSGIPLSLDHITPLSAGGENLFDNLCSACRPCNEHKNNRRFAFDALSGAEVALFNPRTEAWADHCCWSKDGTHIEGLTAVGRATIVALKLNNSLIVKARARWVSAGWHPPNV